MTGEPWTPSKDEVRKIVAELRPVIDECVRRSRQELAQLFTLADERSPGAA